MTSGGGEDLAVIQLSDVVAAGGDTLGRFADGRVVFCEGGLPGETVRVRLVADRRDYARAEVVLVDSPSADRVQPPCPHATAGCGGCQWQHVSVGAQLRFKASIVADSWRRLAHAEAPSGPPAAGVAPDAYRTSLRLVVDAGGRPAYQQRHSHRTIGVDSCLVAHPLLEGLLTGTLLRTARAPVRRKPDRRAGRARPGERPEVALRVGLAGGERLVHATGGAEVVETPPGTIVVGADDDGYLHEAVGGRRWRVSARSFFQSGPAAAELLVGAVIDAAGEVGAGDHVVDLYAGVGLLGGCVAAATGCRLTSVESSQSAAGDAVSNLRDLDAAVVGVDVGEWEATAADVVIADPARPGLGRPGVAALVATGARRAVVVSCDPASGARDAVLLRDAGYRAVRQAVLDLFPHTVHVEAVTTYERP